MRCQAPASNNSGVWTRSLVGGEYVLGSVSAQLQWLARGAGVDFGVSLARCSGTGAPAISPLARKYWSDTNPTIYLFFLVIRVNIRPCPCITCAYNQVHNASTTQYHAPWAMRRALLHDLCGCEQVLARSARHGLLDLAHEAWDLALSICEPRRLGLGPRAVQPVSQLTIPT